MKIFRYQKDWLQKQILLACTLLALLPWIARADSPVEKPRQKTHKLLPSAPDFLRADEELPIKMGIASTVEDYVRYALLHNPALQASYYRWLASVQEIPQQTTLPDPSLSYTYFIDSIETRTGPQDNLFSLSQTFPWLGKLNAAGNVARQESERLWWKFQRERLELIRAVKTAYYDYAFLGKTITINSTILQLLQGLDPIAQQQVRGGGTYADLLQLQVEIGLMEDTVETLKSYRPAQSARLEALLNLPRTALLSFPSLQPPHMARLNTKMLHHRLSYNNPELNALRSTIQREAQQERVARLSPIPNATLSWNYFDIGKRRDGGPSPPDNGRNAMSITLSFNVPLWFAKYEAEAKQAQANSLVAVRDYKNQANLVEARLEELIAQIRNSQRRITLYRDSLIGIAKEALTSMESSYRGGRNSITDVLDVERRLLQIEDVYWRSLFELNKQLADLEALAGGSLSGTSRPPSPPKGKERHHLLNKPTLSQPEDAS